MNAGDLQTDLIPGYVPGTLRYNFGHEIHKQKRENLRNCCIPVDMPGT
ncbi:MAG: hypothetical protein ACK2U3_04905 [Anaerolineales bacterium]